MALLTLDISHVFNFINRNEINLLQKEITSAHRMLIEKTGQGNDFLGWVNLPNEMDDKMFNDIAGDAQKIKNTAEIFVVVGIGGSYLGSRAVIEALSHNFSPFLKSSYPKIIFAGQNLSEDYMAELLEVLNLHSYALVVISKSGTTTEPAVAFRILKNHLEKKYGKAGARERILAITDKSKGALKKLADDEGYKTYVVPDDIGGRYSVLTPVGLLPIAVAGFDIRALVGGAAAMQKQVTKTDNIDENPSALYAATRNALYRSGKQLEIMVNYEPKLIYLTQWWKQLYGESEGKENKGIYPSGASFTTDLHSMDAEGKILSTVPISFHKEDDIAPLEELFQVFVSGKKKWGKKILVDEPQQTAYTFFVRNGIYSIKRINIFSGELEDCKDIPYVFPKKIQVYKGEVYFLYKGVGDKDKWNLLKMKVCN